MLELEPTGQRDHTATRSSRNGPRRAATRRVHIVSLLDILCMRCLNVLVERLSDGRVESTQVSVHLLDAVSRRQGRTVLRARLPHVRRGRIRQNRLQRIPAGESQIFFPFLHNLRSVFRQTTPSTTTQEFVSGYVQSLAQQAAATVF